MKTQQAHSLGGTRFRASMDSPRRVPPLLWLNLVCLDAPLVAVAWMLLFAQAFRVALARGNLVALFLTAWLIYLGDRLADCSSLQPGVPKSLRQEFCLRHREIWIVLLALVAGFDTYVVSRALSFQTFVAGAVVGSVALIYLVVNHPLGLIWRSLPAKEIAIGVLFAAGTVVALLPQIPGTAAFAVAIIPFAVLCTLNCVSIAVWERDLDRAQGKVSLATRHPRISRYAAKICAALAVLSFGLSFVFPAAISVFVCLGVSAFLLGTLNALHGSDERTALADLVLLTPLVPLLINAL